MNIYVYRVHYEKPNGNIYHSVCTARASNPTTGMRRALEHIIRELRRGDPGTKGWQVSSITFSHATH